MKILESSPERYDRGIRWLSLGRADRVKERMIRENVTEGSRVLEIGVGTGSLAVMAARAGGAVTGFDISAGMLSVARRKIAEQGLAEKIELIEMGVAGMDGLPGDCYDAVLSTLVFSELSKDERAYALKNARRVLSPGGRLALADEVVPPTAGKRTLHKLVRMPLAAATFALTQSSTRAVAGLEDQVRDEGFEIQTAERQALGSFLYLVARKREQ